jgi:hypothetical protein
MRPPNPTARLVPSLIVASLLTMGSFAAAKAASAADRRWADLELRGWDVDVTGDSLVRENGVGTRIDLDRDLGLADDNAIEGRLLLFPTRNLFVRVAYVPLDLEGDQVQSQRIEFGGEVFDVNVRVVSGLDLDYGRLHVGWMFRTASDRLRVGPMIGAAGLRGDASLGTPDLPIPVTASEDFEGGFASLGLLVEVAPISRLELFGEFSQLVGVDAGDITDLEVGARVRLVGELRLVAAVRTLSIDFEQDDDRLEADLEGLSLGLSLRF